MSISPWRPPQWQNQATIILSFPGQGGNAQQFSDATGIGTTLPSDPTDYVFDVVLRASHNQELRRTEHPVQTGASVADHAYIVPAVLVLDIGMSDVMDAYFHPSTWTGAASKSVSAYQTLLALQASRIPLRITTKLRTYTNMLVDLVEAEETAKTVTGLRARVEFGQIFMAQISIAPQSARPQDTGETNSGQVRTLSPDDQQIIKNSVINGVTWSQATQLFFDGVEGAGDWSSVPIDNSNQLVPGP